MTGSRRQRSKREGTFLESVREALVFMKSEIADIKSMILNINANQTEPHGFGAWPAGVESEAFGWGMWYPVDCVDAMDEPFAEKSWQSADSIHAQFSIPPEIGRDELLAFRKVEPVPDKSTTGIILMSDSLERTDNAMKSGTECKTCEQLLEECCCFDIFCRRCLLTADECMCTNPSLRKRRCDDCFEIEDTFALFDEEPGAIFKEFREDFVCPSCAGTSFKYGEFNFVQSGQKCGTCLRLGYIDIEVCSNEQCPDPCNRHRSCMHSIGDRHVCSRCFDNGLYPSILIAGAQDQEARQKAMSAFELRANGIFDLIDQVDSGKINLPKAARDIMYSTIKESYAWFQTSPQTHELNDKNAYLDSLMTRIMTKIELRE